MMEIEFMYQGEVMRGTLLEIKEYIATIIIEGYEASNTFNVIDIDIKRLRVKKEEDR